MPNCLRQRLAWNFEQTVGRTDGDRQSVGKRKEPFDGAVHDADDGSKAGGGLDTEMRVDDGAEFLGCLQSRHEVRRDHRRHGKDRVVVLDRQLVVTEIEHGDLAVGETERPQPVSELDLHIVRGEKA